MLNKQEITISGGGSLDAVRLGDGSQLVGKTITLSSADLQTTYISDNDPNFDENDGNQTLSGAQTVNSVLYADGTRVRAEYQITLNDGQGNSWTAYAYNVENSNPAFKTVEGLVLRPNTDGVYPPRDVALTVTHAADGPGVMAANPYALYAEPPCFTLGTLIATKDGPRAVETLRPGDLVRTFDHGLQPLRWIGRVTLSAAHLSLHPEHVPISFAPNSLAPGLPVRTLRVSPQHRMLVSGWKAELLFGDVEVLVPAVAMVNDATIRSDPPINGVTYLHLLFDRHEIVFAEGAEVESLHTRWLRRTALPASVRTELEALFPELFDDGDQIDEARMCLTTQEGRVLSA
jgi:Hint domain